MQIIGIVLERDLKLALRRFSEIANPWLFFVIVTSLFPLALSPGVEQLRLIGTGVIWVAALLSSLLALDGLFRNDMDDGSLEQLLISPAPLSQIVLGKLAAHWLLSSLPLVLLVPVVGLTFYIPAEALLTLGVALLLATPTITVLVAIGASLTVTLRNAGSVIGLLILPLLSPLLIFGTRATDLAITGEPVAAPLYLLGSLAALALSLGPIAIMAALRVGLE